MSLGIALHGPQGPTGMGYGLKYLHQGLLDCGRQATLSGQRDGWANSLYHIIVEQPAFIEKAPWTGLVPTFELPLREDEKKNLLLPSPYHRMFCLNPFIKEELQKLNPDAPERCFPLIQQGANPQPFNDVQRKRGTVGTVGKYEPRKGYDTLFSAINQLNMLTIGSYPNYYAMATSPLHNSQEITEIQSLCDEHSVQLLPWESSQENVAAFLSSLHVAVFPSKAEGFNLCILPNKKVTTEYGYKSIEEVEIGDQVLTHKARYKTVTETFKRSFNGKAVKIRLSGGDILDVTDEHPIFAIKRTHKRGTQFYGSVRNKKTTPSWIPAKDIDKLDLVWVPRPTIPDTRTFVQIHEEESLTSKYSNRGNKTVTARQVANAAGVHVSTVQSVLGNYQGRQISNATRTKVQKEATRLGWKPLPMVPSAIELDEDLGFFFGQYAAEGCAGVNNGTIDFSSHLKEQTIRDRLIRICKEKFSLPHTEILETGDKGNGAHLVFGCKRLMEAAIQHCGRGAYNKKAPSFAWKNYSFAKGFIIGAWLGDGHTRRESFTYVSVSEQLVKDIRSLLLHLGIRTTVHQRSSKQWVLATAGTDQNKLAKLLGKPAYNKKQRDKNIAMHNGWWVPVVETNTYSYSGPVYNIEVDEDHSYTIENTAVHNCLTEALAQGCIVVASDIHAHRHQYNILEAALGKEQASYRLRLVPTQPSSIVGHDRWYPGVYYVGKKWLACDPNQLAQYIGQALEDEPPDEWTEFPLSWKKAAERLITAVDAAVNKTDE